MSTQKQFLEIKVDLYRRYSARVVTKDSYNPRFWKTLDRLLKIVSFGKLNNFLQRTTTVGRTIAFPVGHDLKNPTERDVRTLRHEGRHVSQFCRYGVIGMALLYLFLPVPILLAYFRYRFEREAFFAELDFARTHGWDMSVDHIIDSLCGADYFWSWPRKWVEKDFAKYRN